MTDPRPRSYEPDDPLAPLFGAGEIVTPRDGYRTALREQLMVTPIGALPAESAGSGAGARPTAGNGTFPWPAVLSAAVGVAILAVALWNRPSSNLPSAPPPANEAQPLAPLAPVAWPTPAEQRSAPGPVVAPREGMRAAPPPESASQTVQDDIAPLNSGAATIPAAAPSVAAPPTEQSPVEREPRDTAEPPATAAPSPSPTDGEPGEPPPVPPTPTPEPSPVPRPTTIS